MAYKAVQLSIDHLMTDQEKIHEVPPGTLDAGLGVVLDKLAGRFDGEGVVMVDEPAARAMRLPVTKLDADAAGADHEVLREARSYGWKVGALSDWSTWRRDGLMLRVGILPAIDSRRFPLLDPNPRDGMGTLTSLGLWQTVTGSAYHGTPGMAGIAVMARVTRIGRKHLEPTWKPKLGHVDGFEDDYHTDQFRAPRSGKLFAHSYDANRMYIAAAANAILCPWQLKPGSKTFDSKKAGWWQVKLSPWNDPRIPHPAGYHAGDGPVWITTPTAILLQELTDEGVYGGFQVLDSRVGDGSEILRPWAWQMRDAYARAGQVASDSRDTERVMAAVKEAGRETLGLVASQTNWIYRPDWWYSIIAIARGNLWRKMWRTGQLDDRWPLWIDVDNVWYASDIAEPVAAAPKTLAKDGKRFVWEIDTTGMKLGAFKPKHTRRARTNEGEK